MRTTAVQSHSAARRAGFSLIEIIVVVGLLTFIILGLLIMFNQTQRVLRAGVTQTDALEGGRLITDMMRRELLQVFASHERNAVNFYVQQPPNGPMLQDMPGGVAMKRTNMLEQLYFLTRENQTWSGVGYVVINTEFGAYATNFGTLYRFESAVNALNSPGILFTNYTTSPLTKFSRVLDGVVHFKVRCYDTNGVWITNELKPNNVNSDVRWSTYIPGEIGLYNFYNDAVPAYVEFEIGVLEDRVYDRLRSIPPGTARDAYLARQAGRVHVFRTRVPIHNVDIAAYK